MEILVQFGLNYLKQQGMLPIVIDYVHFVLNSRCFVAGERCEFISRLLNNNVVATKNNIKADYDMKSLGARQCGIQKKSKTKMATTTVSYLTSMPPSPLCAQQQVFSTKTASSKFVTKRKNSHSQSPSAERSKSSSSERSQSSSSERSQFSSSERSQSSSAERSQSASSQCSQSPPPKKQSNKLATPILNRLRAKPNGRIGASSSPTSSSRNVPSAAKSKNKKIGCGKKRGHSSDDEKSDENQSVLPM